MKPSHSKFTRRVSSDWCNIEVWHPPSTVIRAVQAIELAKFGEGDRGVRALSRMNARAMAALLEFTDLSVINAGRVLGLNRDQAFNARRKWQKAEPEMREMWIKVVYREMCPAGQKETT